MFQDRRRLFSLGRVVATRNALAVLNTATVVGAIRRHASGDWGELSRDDRAANEAAVRGGGRLLSVYRDQGGRRFYVITESDRSVTTVLLPEDY